MFHPGDTVRMNFIVPFSRQDIGSAIVSYKQRGHIVLEKTATSEAIYDETEPNEEPVDSGTSQLTVDLSERETLLFADKTSFSIQINIFSDVSGRVASEPIYVEVGEQYYRKTMSETINEQTEEAIGNE